VVAISDHSSTILIHRDSPGAPLTLGPQDGVRGAHVSPDGKWVATGSGFPKDKSRLIKIWHGQDGSYVCDLPLSGEFGWGRFSPDSKWFASYTGAGSKLWKVGEWNRAVRSYPGEFVFSPDGRLIAVGDVAGCIRQVEIDSDREVARLAGPEPVTFTPKCFTPDGTRLVATRDATYVWDLRLIGEQLKAMGLDRDWPHFPAAGAGAPRRISLTIDDGMSATETPGAATRPN
jgi:WD40 repeat protein